MHRVYLAGPIGGCSYLEATAWRDYVVRAFQGTEIECLSPMRGKDFLRNEAEIDSKRYTHPLSTDKGILARDRQDSVRADLVLFNLVDQPNKISAGTCIEMGWADGA